MSDNATTLYDAKKNGIFTVVSTPAIGLLESLGVREGTIVSLQNRYAFGGPVLLRVENAYSIALGKDIAKKITVREAEII